MDNSPQKTQGTEKRFDTPPELGAPEAQPEAANPPGKNKRDFVSKGEHIHKWTTYLGVDWIFNAAAGVSFSYWAKYSRAGQKYWSGPITGFFMKSLTFIKDTAQRKKSADYGNTFMSIMAGGMFTLPPLLILENKKVKLKIIKFLDRHIYGKDRVENDPKFQEAYKEIEDAPKKKFWRGMGARFTALAPLLAIVMVPFTQKISDRIWFNHVEKLSAFTGSKLGLGAKSFNTDGAGKWNFIHKNVAMDFGLGVPYAILHAFFYNLFSGTEKKSKQPSMENAGQKTPAASAQVNTAPDSAAMLPEKRQIMADGPSVHISGAEVTAMSPSPDLGAAQLH